MRHLCATFKARGRGFRPSPLPGASNEGASRVEKTSREDNNLASMQNNSGPEPAVKIPANVAEPSADAIYTAYPNQGPGFYCYVELNSSRRITTLGRPRRIAAKLKPLEVGNTPLIQECQEAP